MDARGQLRGAFKTEVEKQLEKLLDYHADYTRWEPDMWVHMDFGVFENHGDFTSWKPNMWVQMDFEAMGIKPYEVPEGHGMYTDTACWPDLVFLKAFAAFSGTMKRDPKDDQTNSCDLDVVETVSMDHVFTVGPLSRDEETVLLGHFEEGSPATSEDGAVFTSREHVRRWENHWRYGDFLYYRQLSHLEPVVVPKITTDYIEKQFRGVWIGVFEDRRVSREGFWWIPSLPIVIAMATPTGKLNYQLKKAMSQHRVAWMAAVVRRGAIGAPGKFL
jgi:hypothetical protein